MVRMPVAVWLIATAFIGCDQHQLTMPERALRTVVAIALLITNPTLQIGGMIVGVGIVVLHRIRAKNKQTVTETGQ
jgi:hypothetical protein